MPITTSLEFGDIVLVPFPFTDQAGAKRRPAVVVSSARYNQRRSDIILMVVSGQIRSATAFGELVIAGWKEAGLHRPSVIQARYGNLSEGSRHPQAGQPSRAGSH